MWPSPQFPADLVTFTEEILNGKPHFLYSGSDSQTYNSFSFGISFKSIYYSAFEYLVYDQRK